ncbi:MAG: hypothetical protein HY673_18765 [Chloroflexi bacterium]|nr:hypothetical protein [Chloroflexota bacterium]
MKKIVAIAIAAVLLLSLGSGPIQATGNGAPSGAHYNLNIIGVPKAKTADMTNADGHVIFVSLNGQTQIQLSEGDYQVLDANGTDGKAAFRMPNPDPDGDGITAYSVYARALGKPGGSATILPYVIDPVTGETFYSTGSTVLVRGTGKSSFDNVSKQLLYVYADLDGDGIVDRLPLFGDATLDYFWHYDNHGLKLAQLRFYEIPTNVN